MRKITLLLPAIIICFALEAQITITQSDFAVEGMILHMANDTLPSPTLDAGQPGTNQTWNFAGVSNHYDLVFHFIAPATAPFSSDFPDANLVADIIGSGYHYYLESTPSVISIHGQSGDFLGIGAASAIRIIPAETLVELPANYLDDFTSVSLVDETLYFNQVISGFQIDSVRFKSHTNKGVVTDAWGSITTPDGTFDALRQNITKQVTDSVWGLINFGMGVTSWQQFDDTVYTEFSYSWLANNTGLPLVEAAYDTATNALLNLQWLQTSLTVKEEQEFANLELASQVNIFPNPASSYVTIETVAANNSHIDIIFENILGQRVYFETYQTYGEFFNTSIPLTGFENGLYLVRISNGEKSSAHRLRVIR